MASQTVCLYGGNYRKLCRNDDCQLCQNRSFASSDKAKFFSDKNGINPRYLCKSSAKKYIFNCDKCNHEFEIALSKVLQGKWCSYCSNRRLCDNDDCNICFNKSFASSHRAQYWSKKNSKKPREVFKSSGELCIFDCDKCEHEFSIEPYQITGPDNIWCPFCANRRLCHGDCTYCYNKTFATSDKAKFWSPKNKKKPCEVFKNTHEIFIFDCTICKHEFTSSLDNITSLGRWCPFCSNKKLCSNECNYCYNKSFATCDKAKFWSKKIK